MDLELVLAVDGSVSIAAILMIRSVRNASAGGVDWYLVNDPSSALKHSLKSEKVFRPVTTGDTAINLAIHNALHRLHTSNYDGA